MMGKKTKLYNGVTSAEKKISQDKSVKNNLDDI